MQVVLVYQRSDYLSLMLYGMVFFCTILLPLCCCMMVAVAAPSFSAHLNSNAQALDLPGIQTCIWVVFGFVVVMLILNVLTAFTDDRTEVVTLSAITSIILALLAGSTWIVATSPVIDEGIAQPIALQEDTAAITEPFAPQEDTAAKTNEGDMA